MSLLFLLGGYGIRRGRPHRRWGKKVSGGHFFRPGENPWAGDPSRRDGGTCPFYYYNQNSIWNNRLLLCSFAACASMDALPFAPPSLPIAPSMAHAVFCDIVADEEPANSIVSVLIARLPSQHISTNRLMFSSCANHFSSGFFATSFPSNSISIRPLLRVFPDSAKLCSALSLLDAPLNTSENFTFLFCTCVLEVASVISIVHRFAPMQ